MAGEQIVRYSIPPDGAWELGIAEKIYNVETRALVEFAERASTLFRFMPGTKAARDFNRPLDHGTSNSRSDI